MTYYVKNVVTPGKIDYSLDLASMKTKDGLSLANSFQFLQEVFYEVYSDTSLLVFESVTITVYLEDGDEHYFFSCYNDLYEDYEWD